MLSVSYLEQLFSELHSNTASVIFKKFSLFIFGCGGCLLLCGPFSSLSKQGLLSRCDTWTSHFGASLVVEHRLSDAQASALVTRGLSSRGCRALEPQAQSLWCVGSVAPRDVGSSCTRDQNHVSCTGSWILYS